MSGFAGVLGPFCDRADPADDSVAGTAVGANRNHHEEHSAEGER